MLMFRLPGYVIREQIYGSSKVKVYRGYTINNGIPVIIKVLKKSKSNSAKMASFFHEYEITRSLNSIEGIVRPEKIEQTNSVIALIARDLGAISLKKYMQNRKIDLSEFLTIAVQLSETLGMLHSRGIIHGDLKPGNVVIETGNKKVYIIDFSSAVSIYSPNYEAAFFNSDKTYEYMAPELTGLLNIGADFRSDLYSLGVMLYELITGVMPFKAETREEWINVHISQIAKPPHEIVTTVPRTVSDMIMKLLAKSPDERYQSAGGLLYDLKKCRNQLANTGEIHSFRIGLGDVSGYFISPKKLVGRETEKRFLADALARVTGGKSETILVIGDPGIGKTMLVDKSLRHAVGEKGFFISGKFDQLKSNIPYAPFASAFGELIRQLMTKSEKELNEWKKAIQYALGRRGAVIAQVIPELEWVIGKQQPVDELPPNEAQNRFLMVFRDFVKVFARANHPLVIFIDDLQWADYSSLKLFKYLSQEANLRNTLFIGALRDNELNEDHPLKEFLDRINTGELNRKCSILNLKPLQNKDFSEILSGCLHVADRSLNILSDALFRITGGNPLFLGQLLNHIFEKRLVYFDQHELKLDIDAINALRLGDDVLEVLVQKLDRLPEETRKILKVAACIGNRFDLYSVSKVCLKDEDETLSCLMPAIIERLIVSRRELYDFENNTDESYEFEFLHDRVQQAVYSSVPEHEKKEKHLEIGRIFLKQADNIEDNVMFIMDQFNRSIELINDEEEREKLAGYNLIAGRRAKLTAAYSSALQYFRAGRALLGENSWETNYKLSYELHLELAQTEYLSVNIENAEKLFDLVIDKARTDTERANVYGLKVILYASVGKYTEAIHTGIHSLRKLGVRIPVNPTKFDYLKELLVYKFFMLGRKIETLEHLPEMTKPEKIKTADLLSRLSSVTMSTIPDLYSFVILKTGNHALRHGNSEMTCVGYAGYGITEGCVLGNYRNGEKYARISLNLVEKYGKSSSKCIVYFVVGSLICHWTQPSEIGLMYLKKAVQAGMEAGDLLIIGYSHCLLLENRYIMGVKLPEIMNEIRKKREVAERIKHENLSVNVEIYENIVNALMGLNDEHVSELAPQLDNEYLAECVKKDKSSLATWHIRKMQLYYLSGDYRNALAEAEAIRRLMGAIFGFLLESEYIFYYAISITAVFNELSPEERKYYRKILRRNYGKLRKWAESCPENFEDWYLIVSAEITRINNKREKSMHLYEKAIQSARKNRHINNEAIANELTAKFYLSLNLKKIARTYMNDACNCYRLWGAYAKIMMLKDKYPELTEDVVVFGEFKADDRAVPEGIRNIERETGESSDSDNNSAEINYIDKIVENIYSESDINQLLVKFIDAAIRTIGATKGYFILEINGELYIESGKDNNRGKTVAESTPLEEYPDISKTVVRYVARTLETVVLNCEKLPGIFAVDTYIAESNPKSIACIPVLFQGIALGVMYFENNFIAGVFDQKRIERLKVLSSQVACVKKFQSYLKKDYGKNNDCIVEMLTEREMEVLRLIAEGMSNKEIAKRMLITINTVKTYIKNIYEKLGVNRRVQVVSKAKELNLLK